MISLHDDYTNPYMHGDDWRRDLAWDEGFETALDKVAAAAVRLSWHVRPGTFIRDVARADLLAAIEDIRKEASDGR